MALRLRNTINAIRRIGINIPALLIALWFLVSTAGLIHPKTAEGIQCPTAPIQTVLRAVKDKCGCVIGVRADAPKPGDKTFVQCRCAEKKSSDLVASTSPKFELMQLEAPVIAFPDRPYVPDLFLPIDVRALEFRLAPPTLPPGLA